MHAAKFGAAAQGRKHLARIEQPFLVEGAFQSLLLVEIDLGEHDRHQITLLDADASRRRRGEVVDKMAAAYILQGALDRLRILSRS